MGRESPRVLVVDDDRTLADLVVTVLNGAGFRASCTAVSGEVESLIAKGEIDVVLTDLRMQGTNGLELCERVVANRPDIPVIVMTAFGDFDVAIAAMRAGAWDFLAKPFDNDVLVMTVERAVKHRALREEVKRLRSVADRAGDHSGIVGSSPAMRELYDLLERVVESDATVLIMGESGTGKEVVARAIHRRSKRASGPFVAVNCSAIPEALLESELFGHAKGAFTDARTARPGLLLQGQHGTVFLDEIADMPLGLQPKLLRALQERTVRPVGGDSEVPFDARVIAATNRDLESAVEARQFRADLFYRLDVIRVTLPALRSRGNDVLLLAQHFILRYAAQTNKRVTGLSPAAAGRLLEYAWPGNVRELQNAIERAVALTAFESIAVSDLPERIQRYKPAQLLAATDDPNELVTMEELERRYIARVMEAVGGSKTLAARVLGFDRTTLYRKLEKYAANPAPPRR